MLELVWDVLGNSGLEIVIICGVLDFDLYVERDIELKLFNGFEVGYF